MKSIRNFMPGVYNRSCFMHRSIQYCDLTGKLTPFTLDSVPDELDRKTTLLQYFARYMDEHLIQVCVAMG